MSDFDSYVSKWASMGSTTASDDQARLAYIDRYASLGGRTDRIAMNVLGRALEASGHQASTLHQAVNEETSNFTDWALATQKPMAVNEVESFLFRQLGMKMLAPIKRRPGARFQIGDRVEVVAEKHRDQTTVGPYKEFDGKLGTVTGIETDDVLVQMDKGVPAPVRFPSANKASGTGLMAYKEAFIVEGSDKIEMVYLAGGKATPDQVRVVETYLGKGRKGERRSGSYYSGYVSAVRPNASNQTYFTCIPQQRQRVDPKAEAGFHFRSFNPSEGQVLYIGLFGRRPAHWEQEWDTIRSEMEPTE